MLGHHKLWYLFAVVSCVVLLSTCIAYHQILKGYFTLGFQHSLRHVKRHIPSDCFNHSELCQLWFTIQDENHFAIALTGESVLDFEGLGYLKNSYLASGMDLHKVFANTGYMREAVEVYKVNEYEFEAVKKVFDRVKARKGRCKEDEAAYKYVCHMTDCSDGDIKVVCSEYHLDRPTGGGATISGLVYAVDSRASCHTVDLYNGTYHLTCPLLPQLSWISITVNYINFTAFQYGCHIYKERLIKNFTQTDFQQPCPSKSSHSMGPKISFLCSIMPHVRGSTHNHFSRSWIKINSNWYWSNDNCYYSYTISRGQIQCLNATKLLLIGDSHMLSKYKEIYKEYPWIDIEFRLLGLAAQLGMQLKGLIKEYRLVPMEKLKAKSHVIIFNVGHWDVHFLDVFSYITYMEGVFEIINELKREPPYPKVIWMESTPVRRPKRQGCMKTNPVLSALNDWTSNRLRPLGVEVVKAYDIALPMLDKVTQDGSHFDIALGSKADNFTGKINVAGAIVSVMFDMICRDKDPS